jgi:hypothetical protein
VLQQLWEASARSASTRAATPGITPAVSTASTDPAYYTGREQYLAVVCSDSPNPRSLSAYAAAAKVAYARSGGWGLEETWYTEQSNPSTCALNYQVSYLLTGALPPAGTSCQENATPFPAR